MDSYQSILVYNIFLLTFACNESIYYRYEYADVYPSKIPDWGAKL